MNLTTQIESILFVAGKPLSFKQIAKVTGKSEGSVADSIETLKAKYNRDDCGICILEEEGSVRMGTNPACADVADRFIKDEIAGELTKAQLETLTVVAYRGPVSRAEIEEIRGVNCAVILRNLRMRGLVDEHESAEHVLPQYALSVEALRHLGIGGSAELPQYETLHNHDHLAYAAGSAE